MSATTTPQIPKGRPNAARATLPSEKDKQSAEETQKEPQEELSKDTLDRSSMKIAPNNKASNGYPSPKTIAKSPIPNIVVQKESDLLPKDTRRVQKSPEETAAQAVKVQQSLKGLIPWQAKEEGADGQSGGKPIAPHHRGSPPAFVLSLNGTWAGCQNVRDFKAADLGTKVALWIVNLPGSPVSLALYDPEKKALEEQADLSLEPTAVEGVTFTAGMLQDEKVGAFLFGGKMDSGKLLNESWFYISAASKWTKMVCGGKAPGKRWNHACAFSSKTRSFYISGGEGEDTKALEGTYQLLKGEWRKLPEEQQPPARTHHTLSVVWETGSGDHLLVFGGLVQGSNSNDLWSLHTESKDKSWSQITNTAGTPPAPRHGHSAIASSARCFIFGGLGKHWMGWEVPYFDMYVFDTQVSAWFEIPLVPTLSSVPAHRYAVAVGDPNLSLHILAAGEDTTDNGALYSVGAVCSTLDLWMISEGIKDARVVLGDSKDAITNLFVDIEDVKTALTTQQNSSYSIVAKTENLEESINQLMLRSDEIYEAVKKQTERAEELGQLAETLVVEPGARASEIELKIEALENRILEAQKNLEKLEQNLDRMPDLSEEELEEED